MIQGAAQMYGETAISTGPGIDKLWACSTWEPSQFNEATLSLLGADLGGSLGSVPTLLPERVIVLLLRTMPKYSL